MLEARLTAAMNFAFALAAAELPPPDGEGDDTLPSPDTDPPAPDASLPAYYTCHRRDYDRKYGQYVSYPWVAAA